jgi:hypothetical protein
MLNVSRFHRSALPRIQDLLHSSGTQPIARTDIVAIPTQHKIELGELALQVGPVIFCKRWNLGWEADPVRANGLAQIPDIYLAEGTGTRPELTRWNRQSDLGSHATMRHMILEYALRSLAEPFPCCVSPLGTQYKKSSPVASPDAIFL